MTTPVFAERFARERLEAPAKVEGKNTDDHPVVMLFVSLPLKFIATLGKRMPRVIGHLTFIILVIWGSPPVLKRY